MTSDELEFSTVVVLPVPPFRPVQCSVSGALLLGTYKLLFFVSLITDTLIIG